MTEKKDTKFVPGGATQGSIRFAQWLLQAPGATTYMGCVGKDKYGDILKESMDKAGVKVRLWSLFPFSFKYVCQLFALSFVDEILLMKTKCR